MAAANAFAGKLALVTQDVRTRLDVVRASRGVPWCRRPRRAFAALRITCTHAVGLNVHRSKIGRARTCKHNLLRTAGARPLAGVHTAVLPKTLLLVRHHCAARRVTVLAHVACLWQVVRETRSLGRRSFAAFRRHGDWLAQSQVARLFKLSAALFYLYLQSRLL